MESLKEENRLLREQLVGLEKRISDLEQKTSLKNLLDQLGLADEGYFTRRLNEAVRAAERYARFLCVVLIDVSQSTGEGPRPLEVAARFREIFRRTDLVAYYENGRVFVLLEEAEAEQGLLALRRVQRELVDIPPPRYSMACFPNDTNRDETLLEILEERLRQLKVANTQGPAVHFGDNIVALSN
jgi:GGDEF domain-containing protein